MQIPSSVTGSISLHVTLFYVYHATGHVIRLGARKGIVYAPFPTARDDAIENRWIGKRLSNGNFYLLAAICNPPIYHLNIVSRVHFLAGT